jgi:hypothetical protein
MTPSKIVSVDPDFQPRWPPRTHPGTIPARFGLILFSGFRGEDLNVIFYQNMPNLHNRYISAERKISQISQNVPKFELYKHNDELFSIYYRIFYEL